MTFPETEANRAVRHALRARLPEKTPELSFERIDRRATHRRRRMLATQFAGLVAMVLCAGTAVAVTHPASTPTSLRVTNSSGSVPSVTTVRPGHHVAPTTLPAAHPITPGTAPTHSFAGPTPGSSPYNPIASPTTLAPSGHTPPAGTTPATSPPANVATPPTTPYRPMIPSNLPPMSQYATSRFLVILTDDGYYISDSTGLHTKLNAHVSGPQFDVVFLDERAQSTDDTWLGTFVDQKYDPMGHAVQAYTHAWDGGQNPTSIREVFTTFSYSGPLGIGVWETGNDSMGLPGTRATLNLIKDA
jgi:hypothetical protein